MRAYPGRLAAWALIAAVLLCGGAGAHGQEMFTLAGIVTDAGTDPRMPLPGTTVTVRDGDRERVAVTSADGRFSSQGVLPIGSEFVMLLDRTGPERYGATAELMFLVRDGRVDTRGFNGLPRVTSLEAFTAALTHLMQ